MWDVEEILRNAKEAGASDVHITVGIAPRMRINGRLVAMENYGRLLPADTRQILESVLTPEQLQKFEQQGELDLSYAIPSMGRFRINAYKQRNSAAMAFRLVQTNVPSAAELGLPDTVSTVCQCKRGLVLVTGPTGSGKSTTLASMIDLINHSREAHVITLEDPIEYMHRHDKAMVNQREIGLDSQNYANALRAALREDPDVILVGEMRDYETISIAITAAETGHLVLSTLHTVGAANTVDRVIDVFPASQQQQIRVQLANTLEAVFSQQLIPKADGQGRVAAFEVLRATPAVRNIIREGKTHQLGTVMQTNRKLGMITMDESILQLYQNKIISKEMAIQFAQDVDSMKNKLSFL